MKQAISAALRTIRRSCATVGCAQVLPSSAGTRTTSPGSCGRACPGRRVAIVDGQGNVLPPGEDGQIAGWRHDPIVMLEYWRNPEATAKKFAGDWLLTGDLGRIDEDGYVFFKSRDDDVIT